MTLRFWLWTWARFVVFFIFLVTGLLYVEILSPQVAAPPPASEIRSLAGWGEWEGGAVGSPDEAAGGVFP